MNLSIPFYATARDVVALIVTAVLADLARAWCTICGLACASRLEAAWFGVCGPDVPLCPACWDDDGRLMHAVAYARAARWW